MKPICLAILLSLLTILTRAQNKQQGIPHLVKYNDYAELVVNGSPFLMLGGELGNSSASDMGYMKPIWPKLKKMHLNTLVSPVYWELLEPEEGSLTLLCLMALLPMPVKIISSWCCFGLAPGKIV
jgi:hypothetical protein